VFWSFFEQMGSSTNNFTDRNIDRVPDAAVTRVIKESDVGPRRSCCNPPQSNSDTATGDSLFTIDVLNKLREEQPKERERRGGKSSDAKLLEIEWKVAPDKRGHEIGAPIERNPRHDVPVAQTRSIFSCSDSSSPPC
jgi:hypothetical protein